MICPVCGSYQPNRAKFCGVCGASLSQEELVESFLKDAGKEEIVLPRHRSFLFYAAVGLAVLLALAVLAGAGYLIYRVGWGEKETAKEESVAERKALVYSDPDLGFTFSYPEGWRILEQAYPADDELASLTVLLTSHKKLDLHIRQLDPVVSVGGLEGIQEFLDEDAARRIQSLGGGLPSASAPAGQTPAYTPTPQESEATTDAEPTPGAETNPEGSGSEDLLHTTYVNGLPAYYTEFNANYMGEGTKFLIFYVIAGDYIFQFQGQSPSFEYVDMRPLFMSITNSLKWQDPGEEAPAEDGTGALPSARPSARRPVAGVMRSTAGRPSLGPGGRDLDTAPRSVR